MDFDSNLILVFATIGLALLALAVAWGTLRESVKSLEKDASLDRKENREDHKEIIKKIDQILNGGKRAKS